MPLAVGQDEVDDRRDRAGAARRRRAPRSAVAVATALVAGVAQDDLQRAEDLRARRRRRARAGRARSPRGLADRRRRPRARRRERELHRERRALAGQRLGPDPAAVDLDEPARDREAEAGAAVAARALGPGAVEGLEDPLELGGGMPGPRSTTRSRSRPPTARARTDTGWPPEWRTPFSSRFAIARSSWAASARDERQVAVEREREVGLRPVEALDRAADHLVERHPVAPRLGRAGLEPGEVEQLVDEPRQPPRLGRDDGRRARRAPRRRASASRCVPAAVTIAVSGERRSCDTARSSAVFTTSLRRSAAVSTTSASSASRSRAAREQRLERRDDALLQPPQPGLGRVGRDQERAERGRAVAQRERRRRRSVGGDLVERDRGRRPARAPGPAAAPRPAAPSAGRPRAAAAAPSPPRGRPRGGARPPPPRAPGRGRRPNWRASATARNTPSATQFWPIAIVNRPVGGMWKKLNASALATDVTAPRTLPHAVETRSTPMR